MTIGRNIIKNRPLLFFFILTFVISWGGIFIAIGPGGIMGTSEVSEGQMPFVYITTLLGPSVAGILMTLLVDGRAGLGDLFSRLFRWRVRARWYAMALLCAPLLITAVLFTLSLSSPQFIPVIITANDKAGLVLTGLVMGVFVGLFEELGWTGFAVRRLIQHHGVLATGLIVGILWGAWHFPLFSGSASASGALSPALYLFVLLFSFLPAYRVLMVWVYNHNGSLFVTILMHAPLAASQLVLIPSSLSRLQIVTFDLVFAAVLWIIIAALAVANRGRLGIEESLTR